LTAINHTTTGATGIGTPTGLPPGVKASWASNTITITGNPTSSGTFKYTIPLAGGCGSANATGTITVTSNCSGGNSSTAMITGTIKTESNQNVEGVEVNLSGQAMMMNATNTQGQFTFTGLAKEYNYTVTPKRDKNYLNGLSTNDLMLISKHILGRTPLTSPYQLIAADINNSRTITPMDLTHLRRLLLGLDLKFTSNTSWRFVDKSFIFSDPKNPWKNTFPEVVGINNLSDAAKADFVGIKIGDVNGSVLGAATVRSNGTFRLNIEDKALKPAMEVHIPVTANLAGMEGFQFTLGYDRNLVELIDLEYGTMQAEHFGIFEQEGLITASWNVQVNVKPGETLFTLVLHGKRDVLSLGEVLNINSRITAAEAYTTSGEYQKVALLFDGRTKKVASPELYQNIPNPFSGETVIGFQLVEAGEAILTVSDVQGRTLKVIRGQYPAGFNQVLLSSHDLPSGVMQYTLKSAAFIATRRMVVGK
jgi:hypothetical protein